MSRGERPPAWGIQAGICLGTNPQPTGLRLPHGKAEAAGSPFCFHKMYILKNRGKHVLGRSVTADSDAVHRLEEGGVGVWPPKPRWRSLRRRKTLEARGRPRRDDRAPVFRPDPDIVSPHLPQRVLRGTRTRQEAACRTAPGREGRAEEGRNRPAVGPGVPWAADWRPCLDPSSCTNSTFFV